MKAFRPALAATLLIGLSVATPALAQQPSPVPPFYFGADLSYVNEMEDCGAKYRDAGKLDDPFHIFKAHGTNLVRVRLWNDATWTKYSNLADVEKTIARARAQGMQVLLDFHYSDDWADGDHQTPPKAWAGIKDPQLLAAALYKYTYDTLMALDAKGLTPDLVQVGNETNAGIVRGVKGQPVDWPRNALLFNAGIKAVRDAGAKARIAPRVMLHIAQPENAEPWFAKAKAAGIVDYDIIGLSYYSKWSKESLAGLAGSLNRLHRRYGADVMVVETAYPFTLDNADPSPNLMGYDALTPGYPATPEGQAHYLKALTQTVISSGGVGVVYWEPAWVSTRCRTRWGQGSNWDNATFFDFHHDDNLLPAIDYQTRTYTWPVDVAFRIDTPGTPPAKLYLWGDFLGAKDMIVKLKPDGAGHWTYATRLAPGTVVHWQVFDHLPVDAGLIAPDAGEKTPVATVGNGATLVERTVARP
jgi:arabinogalactan endo-1,4-beta-galactosidase